jgi:hypothetical protein
MYRSGVGWTLAAYPQAGVRGRTCGTSEAEAPAESSWPRLGAYGAEDGCPERKTLEPACGFANRESIRYAKPPSG